MYFIIWLLKKKKSIFCIYIFIYSKRYFIELLDPHHENLGHYAQLTSLQYSQNNYSSLTINMSNNCSLPTQSKTFFYQKTIKISFTSSAYSLFIKQFFLSWKMVFNYQDIGHQILSYSFGLFFFAVGLFKFYISFRGYLYWIRVLLGTLNTRLQNHGMYTSKIK